MVIRSYHQKKSERGNTIVVVCAALVVIGAGVASWQYIHASQSRKVNGVVSDNKQDQPTSKPLVAPQNEKAYLTIQEWGIRFKLPETLKGDIYYKTFTNTIGEHGAVFASKRLDGLVGDGSCTFLPRPDGTEGTSNLSPLLSRLDPNDPGQSTLDYYRNQRTYVTRIGAFEYYSVKPAKEPPITCLTGKHEEFNEIERSMSEQLEAGFQSIEAITQ